MRCMRRALGCNMQVREQRRARTENKSRVCGAPQPPLALAGSPCQHHTSAKPAMLPDWGAHGKRWRKPALRFRTTAPTHLVTHLDGLLVRLIGGVLVGALLEALRRPGEQRLRAGLVILQEALHGGERRGGEAAGQESIDRRSPRPR